MTTPPPRAAEMTRTMTPPHCRWSHGDRKRGEAGRSGRHAKAPGDQAPPNFRPEWSSTTTKRHTCGCDECGRDLGYCYHGARTFAQPPQHGQCRHHSLAFQRIDVLCWTVRVLLHRTCTGSRQLATPADRAESLP